MEGAAAPVLVRRSDTKKINHMKVAKFLDALLVAGVAAGTTEAGAAETAAGNSGITALEARACFRLSVTSEVAS